mmetsp:Transcript_49311/g.152350  ORF Transcript_49311/g.152350 Transcript_49311/m.152350 type:complete len:223 (-) Transcript_49311:56-724(-)
MNWRGYREYVRSLALFAQDFGAMCYFLGILFSSLSALPWGALQRPLDPLAGGQLRRLLTTGGPPICQAFPPVTGLFHGHQGGRRISEHWYNGLAQFPTSKATYDGFYALPQQLVPKERLLEWDMRKHRWEDLCRFLEIKDCPRSGKMARAINIFNFERDFPLSFWTRLPLLLLLHHVNWRIFGGLFLAAWWLLRTVARLLPVLAHRLHERAAARGWLRAASC